MPQPGCTRVVGWVGGRAGSAAAGRRPCRCSRRRSPRPPHTQNNRASARWTPTAGSSPMTASSAAGGTCWPTSRGGSPAPPRGSRCWCLGSRPLRCGCWLGLHAARATVACPSPSVRQPLSRATRPAAFTRAWGVYVSCQPCLQQPACMHACLHFVGPYIARPPTAKPVPRARVPAAGQLRRHARRDRLAEARQERPHDGAGAAPARIDILPRPRPRERQQQLSPSPRSLRACHHSDIRRPLC